MAVQLTHQDKILGDANRRLRLLYSLNDLQHALSACEFLYECDESKTYSKIELRRFRCFETTLVIAYGRPFSQSRGAIPPLTMKMIDLNLSAEKKLLHETLINMRNKIIAHSDGDMMRMTTQAHDVFGEEGEASMYFVQTTFDEGITLLGSVLIEANELMREVCFAVGKTIFKEAQKYPQMFNLRIDSAEAKAIRGIISVEPNS